MFSNAALCLATGWLSGRLTNSRINVWKSVVLFDFVPTESSNPCPPLQPATHVQKDEESTENNLQFNIFWSFVQTAPSLCLMWRGWSYCVHFLMTNNFGNIYYDYVILSWSCIFNNSTPAEVNVVIEDVWEGYPGGRYEKTLPKLQFAFFLIFFLAKHPNPAIVNVSLTDVNLKKVVCFLVTAKKRKKGRHRTHPSRLLPDQLPKFLCETPMLFCWLFTPPPPSLPNTLGVRTILKVNFWSCMRLLWVSLACYGCRFTVVCVILCWIVSIHF